MKFCKEEIEQGYDKKNIPKTGVEHIKVNGKFYFKYTYWAPSSRKFFNKLLTYMWPMFTYVWPMCTHV